MPSFTTTYGTVINSSTMREVCRRLENGEDWERVGNEELRDIIPEHDDDNDEMQEVISEAETRNEIDEVDEWADEFDEELEDEVID